MKKFLSDYENEKYERNVPVYVYILESHILKPRQYKLALCNYPF